MSIVAVRKERLELFPTPISYRLILTVQVACSEPFLKTFKENVEDNIPNVQSGNRFTALRWAFV